MSDDRRLIEDYLPIEAISKESSREKAVRKGHISTLHLWWARRPLVACRAAIYGALVPASRFRPANGPEEKRDSLTRANAAKFVERLCQYPAVPQAVADAQEHILEAHSERLSTETGKPVTVDDIAEGRAPRPKVLDMFAGGGAIPLEALRLGCEAYALDLNPVAHIIELCTLVYPQKYGKADPTARGMVGPKNAEGETTWGGLADEVRYWGKWVLEKVRAEICDLYPLIPDPKAKGTKPLRQADMWQSKEDVPPGYLVPIAYLWTHTVRCKNPTCAATVPIVKQTWLCKKRNRFIALRMTARRDERKARFEVVESQTEKGLGFDPAGFSKGGNATCAFCGTVADSAYVKAEGRAKRMGKQMMAIVCTRPGQKGKLYLSADDAPEFRPDDEAIRARIETLCLRTGLTVPSEPMDTASQTTVAGRGFGIAKWAELFTPRQMLCLLTFAAAVRGCLGELDRSGVELERGKAVVTSLCLPLNKLAGLNCSLTRWKCDAELCVDAFGRQALPMVWDFAEQVPFSGIGGSWQSQLERTIAGWADAWAIKSTATVSRGSATALPWSDGFFDAVVTDPPYYDNVDYARLADFFYVWLKRTIGPLYPEHFATDATPKKLEIVADPVRHGRSKKKAREAYEEMMALSFAEARRVLKPGGSMVVVYAHKTTLGWSTLVDALRRSGLTVIEAWPLDTEMKARLIARGTAALASSIFLVARNGARMDRGSYEDQVRPELEQIVRERTDCLWKMGITGADLVIAAVGAGLRAYSRFSRVEYANGEEVPSEKFLAEVEGVVLETLLEKIFGMAGSGVAAVDGPSRFYVLWRYAYKASEMEAGEAIVFTYGQNVELDGQKGLSTGRHALVDKRKGKYRLRDFTERGEDEKLGLPEDGGTPAALIDALHRILWLVENQPRNLNRFLDEARPDRERLRLVAQALAGTALAGKREDGPEHTVATTAAEQAAVKKLVANWRALIDQRLGADAGTLFDIGRRG
ncbi:DUF1156 domain-containing protein [Verrucomicrobium sp. 3C]|uniref:DUF1156 domain-containing protein n=1 Tax=Verrucomicrobium sp. 3C TaxID=1134055 RepID=UPI0003654379|nr:DUF1156 domain-containing protein [Verrucomicrobium sp. 3C]